MSITLITGVKIHGRFLISSATGAVLTQAVAVRVAEGEVMEVAALASGPVTAYNGIQVSWLVVWLGLVGRWVVN